MLSKAKSAYGGTNQKTILSIPDMHCASCPKLVKITLSEIPGVISISASLETKQAIVDYDGDKANTEQFIKAIDEIGYKAKAV